MLRLPIAAPPDAILNRAIVAKVPTTLHTIMIEIERKDKDGRKKEKTGKIEKEEIEKAGSHMRDSKGRQPSDKPDTDNSRDNTGRT